MMSSIVSGNHQFFWCPLNLYLQGQRSPEKHYNYTYMEWEVSNSHGTLRIQTMIVYTCTYIFRMYTLIHTCSHYEIHVHTRTCISTHTAEELRMVWTQFAISLTCTHTGILTFEHRQTYIVPFTLAHIGCSLRGP